MGLSVFKINILYSIGVILKIFFRVDFGFSKGGKILNIYLKKIDLNNKPYNLINTDTMTTTLKYKLQQITDISFSGFNFEIPEDTCNMINYLCTQVGSSGLITNIYQKVDTKSCDDVFTSGGLKNNKKKKGNKSMEVSADEWESIRTFQTTKLEQKSGIDADIDQIRLFLNKLTDKTFLDIRENVFDKINKICLEITSIKELKKVGHMLYDLCSTNKFYSKIFADLFAEMASKYEWLMDIFNKKYAVIMDQYSDIKYIDSDKDYDGFCEMNKINERRRAVTTFVLNLVNNGFINKTDLVNILINLLKMITDIVNQNDRKNEIDELTENVAIIFDKDLIDEVIDNADDKEDYYVGGISIIDVVNSLAKAKTKDYPSLSNKAIFKYMDLIEM